MEALGRILENVVAILLSAVLVVVFLAYFGGPSTLDKYVCDLETDNPIAETVCLIKTL